MTEGKIDFNGGVIGDGESGLAGIPDGEYYFRVLDVQRKTWDDKWSCEAARLELLVKWNSGKAKFMQEIPCHTTFEWKLGAFFCSVGLRQHGEKIAMNWPAAIGQYGRCKIETKPGNKEGKSFKNLNFLDRDSAPVPAWCTEPMQAPQAQQQPANGNGQQAAAAPTGACPF